MGTITTKSTIREIRIAPGSLRSDTVAGHTYLVGYAANYNVLSDDLGGWRERINRRAFARALRENQDVRYLVNHDPNQVLGRTKSGTLQLSDDAKGLSFRCAVPNTSFARDLIESVSRGDVCECSFGFVCRQQNWVKGTDGSGKPVSIRELCDVDLQDISTVTFPAYPGTDTSVAGRSAMFQGSDVEVRQHLDRLRTQARSVNPCRDRKAYVEQLMREAELSDREYFARRLREIQQSL